jgi:CHAD domain-containing protein
MFRIVKPEKIGGEVARIGSEQVRKMIDEIDDASLSSAKKIHQLRKRCKKMRGLVRLVRPAAAEIYREENAFFRELAKPLGEFRDAKTMQDTYDNVMRRFDDTVDRQAFGTIRRRLTLHRRGLAAGDQDAEERLQVAREQLVAARKRIESWDLPKRRFKTVGNGFCETYRRGRSAMHSAVDHGTAEHFHQWRKGVKYHGYHCQIFGELWPTMMESRVKSVEKLGKLLGTEHDTAVLASHIRESGNHDLDAEATQLFLGLLHQYSGELRNRAIPLGKRIYVDSETTMRKRLKKLWKIWRTL